jgi:hypothetical protein
MIAGAAARKRHGRSGLTTTRLRHTVAAATPQWPSTMRMGHPTVAARPRCGPPTQRLAVPLPDPGVGPVSPPPAQPRKGCAMLHPRFPKHARRSTATRGRPPMLRPRYLLPLAVVLVLVPSAVASGLVGRAAAFNEDDVVADIGITGTVETPADPEDTDAGGSGGGSPGGGSAGAAVAQGNAGRAQAAAAKAAAVAQLASQLFGFGYYTEALTARAATAQQHAAAAQQAANLGDRAGARAAMDAALATLEAVANEAQSLSVSGLRGGDPAAPAAYLGSIDGFVTAENLENEAIAAENAAAPDGGSSDSEEN